MKFAISAMFSGYSPDGWTPCHININDARQFLSQSWAADLAVDETEPGDSEYTYLADEADEFNPHTSPWAACIDITASGMLDRADFYEFCDSFGLIAEDCQTLGTLGGPANPDGLAPDVPMHLESQYLIATVRVTPIPDRGTLTEQNWDRVRGAFLRLFGLYKAPPANGQPGVYANAYRDFRR